MSIDRCSRCGDLVDTDDEPEAYVQIADMRKREEWICLCRHHREEYEDEHSEPDAEQFYRDREIETAKEVLRKAAARGLVKEGASHGKS